MNFWKNDSSLFIFQYVSIRFRYGFTLWQSSGGSSTADCMWTDKLKSSLEKLNLWFFSSSASAKMCQWTSFKFSAIKLFSQSFGDLTRCSQNLSCGQCEVSKCLAYRHILKSLVKKLEEKNHKFSFFGNWINFNQVCSSHAICRAVHPWSYSNGKRNK